MCRSQSDNRPKTTARFLNAGIALMFLVYLGPQKAEASPAALVTIARAVLQEAAVIGLRSATEKVLGDRWKQFATAFQPAWDALVGRVPEGKKLEHGRMPGEDLTPIAERMIHDLERNASVQLRFFDEFTKLHVEDQRAILGALDRIERRLAKVESTTGRIESTTSKIKSTTGRVESATGRIESTTGRIESTLNRVVELLTPLESALSTRQTNTGEVIHKSRRKGLATLSPLSFRFGVMEAGKYKETTTIPCSVGQEAALQIQLRQVGAVRYRYTLTQPHSSPKDDVHPGETVTLSEDGLSKTVTGTLTTKTGAISITIAVDDQDVCGPGYHLQFWVDDEPAADVRYALMAGK